jgi:ribosomal protein S18 acetylase RimI-like enzyme
VSLERPRPIDSKDLGVAPLFDCGTPELNDWLRQYAWMNHTSGSVRVYVSIYRRANLIAGYYCLSAGAVVHAEAPERVAKGLARHPIPVVMIGRLAVDQRYAGKGLGEFLMRDAFEHIVKTSDIIGTRAAVVQAKNERAAGFYWRLGFEALSSNPWFFFLLVKDIKKSIAAAS